MDSSWIGFWRPTASPRAALPVGARSVGHGRLQPGWQHGTGRIRWTNLYWGIRGQGGPMVNEEETEVPAEHIVLHPPGSLISGYPIPAYWEYRWLTVDGPAAGAMIKALGLTGPWPCPAGRCPEELFVQLETEIQDVSPAGEYRASVLAYEILCLAARGRTSPFATDAAARIVDQCRAMIEAQYTDPQLSVDRLAQALKVHRSRLARLFKARVGLPPSVFLQRLRLRKAMSLLRYADQTVGEIAFQVGFTDPAYFSRCIAQATGMSPRQLRESL